MKLTLKHHFDSAHILSNYIGKCSNIHGHRWDVVVTMDTEYVNDETGMIIDFGILKNIINKFDHCLIISSLKKNHELIDLLLSMKFKLKIMTVEPTAENIAEHIYDDIYNVICKVIPTFNLLIRLYETPDCYVEFGD